LPIPPYHPSDQIVYHFFEVFTTVLELYSESDESTLIIFTVSELCVNSLVFMDLIFMMAIENYDFVSISVKQYVTLEVKELTFCTKETG